MIIIIYYIFEKIFLFFNITHIRIYSNKYYNRYNNKRVRKVI